MKNLLRLYRFKHNAVLIGRKRQRKVDDKKIGFLETYHKELVKELKIKHRKQIKELQKKHKENVQIIRSQEKEHYEPLLKELREAVSAAYLENSKNRAHYNTVLQYGVKMEETGEKASDNFNKARIKLDKFMSFLKLAQREYADAIKHIETGKDNIEFTQTMIEKEKPKLIKGIN